MRFLLVALGTLFMMVGFVAALRLVEAVMVLVAFLVPEFGKVMIFLFVVPRELAWAGLALGALGMVLLGIADGMRPKRRRKPR